MFTHYTPAHSDFQVKQLLRDLVVKVSNRSVVTKGLGLRGVIRGWSRASIRRLKLRLRNVPTGWVSLLTLTYPSEFPCDGLVVKRHLHAFREWLRREGVRHYWALEFQKRGAPHLHVICNKFINMVECKERWFQIVGSNDEKHRRQGVRVDAIAADDADQERVIGYLVSYLTKAEQKEVPAGFENVGRFWGGSREQVVVVEELTGDCKERNIHRALRIVRKWYESKCKSWGYRFKWRLGRGFIAWGGAQVFARLVDADMRITLGYERSRRHIRIVKSVPEETRRRIPGWILGLLNYDEACRQLGSAW